MSITAYRRSWAGVNLVEDAAIGKVLFANLLPSPKCFNQQVRLVLPKNEHVTFGTLCKGC